MAFTHTEIMTARKAVRPLSAWQPADSGGQIRFRAPLAIGGAIVEGLFLHGRSLISEPGRDVSFSLEYSPVGSKATLDRVDWKPLTGHTNKGAGPNELRFRVIEGSHRHSFNANLTSEGILRSGNLPIAEPIEAELPTFESLVRYIQRVYNIEGLENLPPPQWMEDLFG
jgi:hypothetical protein